MMRFARKKTRAMALLVLLMVSVLCMMMLAAFLGSNRTYLQLFNRGVSDDIMSDATRTLSDFARCELEKNKTWGLPFAKNKADGFAGDLRWYEHRVPSEAETGILTGTLPNGLVFRMDVVNNLRGTETKKGVEPKACNLKVAVYDNPRHVDLVAQPKALLDNPGEFPFAGGCRLTYRNAALFDSGVLASTGIALHAGNLSFLSKDPVRNQIRSNSHIIMPEATKKPDNYDFGFLRETTPDTFERYTPRGYDGTVWAKDDIVFDDDAGLDEDKIQSASEITNAHFIPKARTQNDIPELSPEDIKVANDDSKRLEAGGYRFSKRWVQYNVAGGVGTGMKEIPVLEQRRDVDSDDLPDVFYYLKNDLWGADQSSTKLFKKVGNSYVAEDVPHVAREAADDADTFELWDVDGDPTGLVVDLSSRTMLVKPDAVVDVPGDFSVTSQGDADQEYVQPVKLILGKKGKMGTIRAQGGIRVDGYVSGKGSLISDEDVVMRPNDVDVKTDVTSDLAIYAKRDVIILDEMNSADSKNVSFKGLVYAGRNFHFRSDTNLNVEGAIVAREGHVYLVAGTTTLDAKGNLIDPIGRHSLNVTYNPDYLDSLLNTAVQDRTKVELMAWRPGI